MIHRVFTVLGCLLTTAAALPAFQAGAYIPHYRIEPLPGAENFLGRPSWDAAPGAWDGRIAADADPNRPLPVHWADASWSEGLRRNYDAFYVHIPMDDAFLDGSRPDPRHMSWLDGLAGAGTIAGLSLIGHSDVFLPIAEDAETRRDFALQLARLCEDYGLNGIDLDWEFTAAPRPSEKAAIAALAGEIDDYLPAGSLLSAAVSRWRLPDRDFFEEVDRVHLMAYDGYGRHATIEAARADAEILLARTGLESEKLILGIPYYGRVYDPESEEYFRTTMSYRDIVAEYGPADDDDEAGGFFFNGRATVARKTAWALEVGLGGVFVWEPYYDGRGNHSLGQAIQEEISRR